jgi:alpha-galactosidase
MEWDIASATAEERAELAVWIALHKRFRDLLHSGKVVRADHPDPDLWVHGVVDQEGQQAIFAIVSMRQRVWTRPGRVRLPGLVDGASYRVTVLPPTQKAPANDTRPVPWRSAASVELRGSALGHAGIEVPSLYPEQLLLIHLETVG